MVQSAKVGLSPGSTHGSKFELAAVGPITRGLKFSGIASPSFNTRGEKLVMKPEEQLPN
jgi:hypothetical protein